MLLLPAWSCTQNVANAAAFSAAQLAALRFIPFIMSVFISRFGLFSLPKIFQVGSACTFYLLLESVPSSLACHTVSPIPLPSASCQNAAFIANIFYAQAAPSRLRGYGYICSYRYMCRYSRLYTCRCRYTHGIRRKQAAFNAPSRLRR